MITHVLRPLLTLAGAGLIALALVACDDSDEPSEPEPQITGTESERIEATSLATLQALIDHDAEALRAQLNTALQDTTEEQRIEEAAACIPPGVQLAPVDGEVNAFGEDASAFIFLEVVGDPEAGEIEFHFDMIREEDGRWSLIALPDCPFDE